ncbi:S1C family serine protease [Clostridium sp.]|uniref:S1C family serine protease n=1 Tax=Clostridium sp. TaxID=1506 RepID=UPI0025BD953E|nr:S1C family serine protease [Clostridium sp.]MBS4957012.1 serine protease [Clostridium sp.]MDU4884055.1 S1C family serine protease [Clostridium celatum]MDU7077885.1 S1C family serine protease [Clostridium celatum]
MSNKEDGKRKISNNPQDRISNIIFEKKNTTRTRVKFGAKIILYVAIAGALGAIISNINIKSKYGGAIQQIEEIKESTDMVILDYTKIIKDVSPSLVSISDSAEKLTEDEYFEGNITGVIIDSSGIILTNYSGIRGKSNIYVKLSSVAATPIKAQILVENEDRNLAIIKIEFDGELQPIKIADSDSIKEGQGIVVLGNAIGDDYIGSSIPGVITSKNEKITIEDEREQSLLQINAPINEKNTGGAICNSKGELVGIADLSITNERNEEGLYYGLQMEEFKDIINSTNAFKRLLGIIDGGIVVDEVKGFSGLYIQELDKEGSAYLAGIKPTDIIIEVDGYKVENADDLIQLLQNKKKDDILHCKVLSEGEMKSVDIKIY